jgi:hypothetical protein
MDYEFFKDEWRFFMSISGITQTLGTTPTSTNAINFRLQASVQVMDMANSAFEQAAAQLIESMAAMTGAGQNVDMVV